jgi:hypothetical protein
VSEGSAEESCWQPVTALRSPVLGHVPAKRAYEMVAMAVGQGTCPQR